MLLHARGLFSIDNTTFFNVKLKIHLRNENKREFFLNHFALSFHFQLMNAIALYLIIFIQMYENY